MNETFTERYNYDFSCYSAMTDFRFSIFDKIFFIPSDSCFCLYRQHIAIVQCVVDPGLALKNQKSNLTKLLFFTKSLYLTGGVHERIDAFCLLNLLKGKAMLNNLNTTR